MTFPRRGRWRQARRRFSACAALAVYLAAAIGFPVSSAPARSEAASLCGGRPGCCGPGAACCGCCSARQAEPEGVPPCCAGKRAADPAPTSGVRWVAGPAALKCQGFPTLWVGCCAAVLPACPLVWRPSWLPAGRLRLPASRPLALPSPPADPPPRSHGV